MVCLYRLVFLMHSCIMPHIQMSLILITKLLTHLNNTNFLRTLTPVSWECVWIGGITHLVESPCPILLEQPTKTLPLSTYFNPTTFSYLKALHNTNRAECLDAATSKTRALTQSQTQAECSPNGYFWYLRQAALTGNTVSALEVNTQLKILHTFNKGIKIFYNQKLYNTVLFL